MRIFLTTALILSVFSFSSFAATSATDIPLGQSPVADDLFETQRGYFHPGLGISGVYTDNLFNAPSNNQDDEFITTITPSLWVAFPGMLEPAEPINTVTTAVGGLALGRFGEKDDRPFQAYLNYAAGIKRHKNFSEEDITTHNVQGLIRGTTASGFGLKLSDVYVKSYDAYDSKTSFVQQKFATNLIAVTGDIPLGERFKIQIDYSNFLVNYDDPLRDRSDNTVSGYLYYALSQKTKMFGQYSYLDVAYDTSDAKDNTQNNVYFGVEYTVTGKVTAQAKAGYNNKELSSTSVSNDSFIYELQADYMLTPKSQLGVQIVRSQKETDDSRFTGILGTSVDGSLSQALGQRVTATVNGGWSRDEYLGGDRDDDYLTFSLSLGYAMQKWFSISGGYNFVQRDSTENGLDYDSNGLFINLTGKL